MLNDRNCTQQHTGVVCLMFLCCVQLLRNYRVSHFVQNGVMCLSNERIVLCAIAEKLQSLSLCAKRCGVFVERAYCVVCNCWEITESLTSRKTTGVVCVCWTTYCVVCVCGIWHRLLAILQSYGLECCLHSHLFSEESAHLGRWQKWFTSHLPRMELAKPWSQAKLLSFQVLNFS